MYFGHFYYEVDAWGKQVQHVLIPSFFAEQEILFQIHSKKINSNCKAHLNNTSFIP